MKKWNVNEIVLEALPDEVKALQRERQAAEGTVPALERISRRPLKYVKVLFVSDAVALSRW